MGLSANSKLAAYSSYLIELSRGVSIIGHISVRGALGSAGVDKSEHAEHGLLLWIMSLCFDPNHHRIVKNKLTSCQALAVCVCWGGGGGGGL